MTAIGRIFLNNDNPQMINVDIIFRHIFKEKFNVHNQRFMMMFLPYILDVKENSFEFFNFLLEHNDIDEDSDNDEKLEI